MSTASIEFRGVSKSYGAVAAVSDLSFSVASGSLVTLLGPSGCGKTTTLRLIAGLELPSRGAIFIDGEDSTRVPASERNVSMVFQSYALFPHMNVLDNVGYGLSVSGQSKVKTRDRARAALATVGLVDYDERLPAELSGGQQQRVALARALVLEPAVLLFDEPLSNLDTRLRRQMREEIRELQQRLSLTVVYVTHDQAEAMAVSDRIIIMNRGGIAQEGTPRQLYEQPHDLFVAGFMGEANRVRGTLTHVDDKLGELTLDILTIRLAHRGLPAGRVDVAIRPEAVELHADFADGLGGAVRKVTYIGAFIEYTVDTALGTLFAISTNVNEPYLAGSKVGVRCAHHGVVPIAPV